MAVFSAGNSRLETSRNERSIGDDSLAEPTPDPTTMDEQEAQQNIDLAQAIALWEPGETFMSVAGICDRCARPPNPNPQAPTCLCDDDHPNHDEYIAYIRAMTEEALTGMDYAGKFFSPPPP